MEKFNPDLLFTEMVNANLLNRENEATINELLKCDDKEKTGTQIFGGDKNELFLGILKLEKIENAANFLLLNMTLFFMPPTVKIIDSYDLLEKDLVKIIIIIVISTFLTMGITGKVVQMMIDYREKKGLK